MVPPTVYGAAQSRRYDADFRALFGGPDRGDLDFFRAMARESEGAICEVGAGTGRVLLALAVGATFSADPAKPGLPEVWLVR